MKGIDISQGSGSVNMAALKKSGYDFIIARAGWGSTTDGQIDKNFDTYITDALGAGLHVGSYWFIYARTIPEAQQNAICFDEVLRPYKGKIDLPVYIDYEYHSTRYYQQETGVHESRDVATQMINVAALQMERLGWYTGVYLNPDYIKNHVNFEILKRYTLWLAEWKDVKLLPSYDCAIWQYAGDTKINDAQGGVDLNICYQTDFPNIIKSGGFNGYEKKQTAETESTVLNDENIGGHGIYDTLFGRAVKINQNGTWEYL